MIREPDLSRPDWAKLPAPADDGAARHLAGAVLPDVPLAAADGRTVSLARLPGCTVVFAFPWMGRPGVPPLSPDWDAIPGARGCTPQSCAFRDLHEDLKAAGAGAVFGLSVQDTGWQKEAVARLHLPFPLLSDEKLDFARALSLPRMEAAGRTLLKRLTFIAVDGRIAKVFYPVFPPDRNAGDVLAWLSQRHTGSRHGR